MSELPKPDCALGYTDAQLDEILGDRRAEFDHWMRGQTIALCEGRLYDHDTREYYESCGGVAHGAATYPWDVESFLAGLPVID